MSGGVDETSKVVIVKMKKATGMKDSKTGQFHEESEAYVRVIISDDKGNKLKGIPVQNTNKVVNKSPTKEWEEIFTLGPLNQPELAMVRLNILDNPHKFKDIAGLMEDEDAHDATFALKELEESPGWQEKQVHLRGTVWQATLHIALSTNGTWGKVPTDGQTLQFRVKSVEGLKAKGTSKKAAVRIKIVDIDGKQVKKHRETRLLETQACEDPGYLEEDEFTNLDDPGNLKLKVNIVGEERAQTGTIGQKPTVLIAPDEDDASGDVEFDLNQVKKVPGFHRFDIDVNGRDFAGTVKLYLASNGEWGVPAKSSGCLCY